MSTSYHWHLKIYFGLGYIWHFKSNFFWYKRGAIFPTWTIMIEFYKLIILVLSRISHTQKDKSTFHSKYNWQLHILYDWNLYLILFKNLSIHWSPPKWQITCLNVCSASIENSTVGLTLKVKLFLHVWGCIKPSIIKKCKKG